MIKHNQDGAISGIAISLGMAIFLLLGAIGFGGWAFASRADYKNNTDSKVKDAVIIAKQQESSAKDAQFVQAEKKPLRTYKGPEAYGSIELQYPKTWSGYIDDTSKSGALLDGYFYPNVVPSITNETSVFALRVQVISRTYSEVLTGLTSANKNAKTPADIKPYSLPKVPGTVGIKVTGTLPDEKQGSMIILPLRSQTLQIWSETSQFTPDFDNLILPNLVFIP